jgi:hypothetical protein
MSNELQAFPGITTVRNAGGLVVDERHHLGMTLRDYFAAKALAGMLADPEVGRDGVDDEPERIADAAYAYADAMLKARGG